MGEVKKATKRTAKRDVIVPPIAVDFEEAVARLLRVKPPAKRKRKSPKR